jgi:hypothetical protein
MKIVISESQYQRLIEADEEKQQVLKIPSMNFFNNDWFLLQKFLEKKGNPLYSIKGDLDLVKRAFKTPGALQTVGGDLVLAGTPISLGNLQSVGGTLDLRFSQIKSLGNLQSVGGNLELLGTRIESLGNLQSVGGHLDLRGTRIESLGNLQSVGGNFDLTDTTLSINYTEEEIRQMVDVGGNIYM